jgi:hypothetical protein
LHRIHRTSSKGVRQPTAIDSAATEERLHDIPITEQGDTSMESNGAMLQNVYDTVREKVGEVRQAATDAVNAVQKIAPGQTGSAS